MVKLQNTMIVAWVMKELMNKVMNFSFKSSETHNHLFLVRLYRANRLSPWDPLCEQKKKECKLEM